MPKKKKGPTPLYEDYIGSPEWQKKRIQAFYALGNKCEVCGSSKNIHVHHNNYGSLGNENPKADLVILCDECHENLHCHVPSNLLGKRSVGYTRGHKCTMCMSTKHKKTKYLSCGLSTQPGHSWRKKKPKVHRILHICERCIDAIGSKLLEENKVTNSMKKKMIREKTETKKKERLLRRKAKKQKTELSPIKAKNIKKPKKSKKESLVAEPPQVVVMRRPTRKAT
jgi:hypothetical protein